MNTSKPEPLIAQQRSGRTCPICGKQAYSLGGIHPQCAVQQADAPRQVLLAEQKRQARLTAEADGTVKAKKPGRPAIKR